MPTLSTQAIQNPGVPASGLMKLTQSALICAAGADAATFLHSQLTNDIKNLTANQVCLAGYCTPKGRLLATMLVWTNHDTVMLQLPLELQEALQKRLQMFVMRAKVKLENVSATQVVMGLFGADTMNRLLPWFPQLPAAPYELVSNQSGTLMRLADADGVARYQWIADKESAEQVWPVLAAQIPVLAEQWWSLSEIHAGIAHICIATQEKFVPQMINYELIGAVNFKKGCYPGQEIVARTHYLGKQKRRTVLAHVDSGNVLSGMEVFAAQDPTQPCGMVVNAQTNPAGGTDCLIEIKTAFYSPDSVQLSTGEICHWLPMPYSLPTDLNEDNPTS